MTVGGANQKVSPASSLQESGSVLDPGIMHNNLEWWVKKWVNASWKQSDDCGEVLSLMSEHAGQIK